MTAEQMTEQIALNQAGILLLSRTIVVVLVLVATVFLACMALVVLTIRQHARLGHLLQLNQSYSELSEGQRQDSRDKLLDKVGETVKAAVNHPVPAEVKVVVAPAPPVLVDPAAGTYTVPKETPPA